MRVFGVMHRTRIPVHQKCHQKCFWIPRTGVFELQNAVKGMFWCVTPDARVSAPKLQSKVFFWFFCMGVFEMQNVTSCMFMVQRTEHTTLHQKCHQRCISILSTVCLKCAMPKSVCFWCGVPNAHTSAPKMPTKVSLLTWYGCV